MNFIKLIFFILTFTRIVDFQPSLLNRTKWKKIKTKGKPIERHEAGFVSFEDQLYLIGGRGDKETSIYNVATNTWKLGVKPPVEIHHFQPLVLKDTIFILGAMRGSYPKEKPLERVLKFYPKENCFEFGDTIPKSRRRGGAGTVVYNDKIYIAGGITNGHIDGSVAWLDEYDPGTGDWKTLADAPFARDHFQAVVNDEKLYAFGGRTTNLNVFHDSTAVVKYGSIYDFKKGKWEQTTGKLNIPTPRAGNAVFSKGNFIYVVGGESHSQKKAHKEVEIFDVKNQRWLKSPSLKVGRHGTGIALLNDVAFIASGCGNRGGTPELKSLERKKFVGLTEIQEISKEGNHKVYQQYHTVTIDIEGPEVSETDGYNPFLNYMLEVEFKNGLNSKKVRGFFAADGNASETSAQSGKTWRVRFNPQEIGDWSYTAKLFKGEYIAIDFKEEKAELWKQETGNFKVIPTRKKGDDFKAKGKLIADGGYFKFKKSNNYWLKFGTNSPENFLAYEGFDDTYRTTKGGKRRDFSVDEKVHRYTPHLNDWKIGDPMWKEGKGKEIIGSINYLSEKGMNAAYFLTMNIEGDGRDVWPYHDPDDFTRFDVSKLAQWNVLFNHMQSKGVLLHIILQETENETLLDKGDTGRLRKLYLQEMIARFGHHNGVVWNIGEENGWAEWSPIAQNTKQRKDMIRFIKENDPYKHPVVIHSHAEEKNRKPVLDSLLGFRYLDGVSFQEWHPHKVSHAIQSWKKVSREVGHPWVITMDEIGPANNGAKVDANDPMHEEVVGPVLWGSIMSGASGVEWYFGYEQPHHDNNSEDWRQRDKMWEISNHAKLFFETLPYEEMEPVNDLVNSTCFAFGKSNELYVIYVPKGEQVKFDKLNVKGSYTISWFNPFQGGDFKQGSKLKLEGSLDKDLGQSPEGNHDWVILLKRINK